MEWLKVMWGRKKSGIDMVMVNESRERERAREGERGGVPEIAVGFSMWHAGGLTYIRTAHTKWRAFSSGSYVDRVS